MFHNWFEALGEHGASKNEVFSQLFSVSLVDTCPHSVPPSLECFHSEKLAEERDLSNHHEVDSVLDVPFFGDVVRRRVVLGSQFHETLLGEDIVALLDAVLVLGLFQDCGFFSRGPCRR